MSTKNKNTIIFGCTGFGKSFVLVSKILKESKRFVLVSEFGVKNELEFMDIDGSDIHEVDARECYKYAKSGTPRVARIKTEENLMYILEQLENTGVSRDKFFTVVFSGFRSSFEKKEVAERLEGWKCRVVIEYSEKAEEVEKYYVPHIMKSDAWEKQPLYVPLGRS